MELDPKLQQLLDENNQQLKKNEQRIVRLKNLTDRFELYKLYQSIEI